ncbi:MAG TPA: hypothetical protein VM103_02670 [Candidatus Paceibacterota bacterium]|nr:hypothetical protein [Candidatus Paceibacterota bacterium]
MTHAISVHTSTRFLITAGLAVASTLAFALPSLASAATYAYVNTAGEVRTVVSGDPMNAIATAPGIAMHSGVLLLTNPADGIVGDNVSGI